MQIVGLTLAKVEVCKWTVYTLLVITNNFSHWEKCTQTKLVPL